MAGQVILFAKEHRKTATGGIRCDPHAIDSAADDGDIVNLGERGRRQGRSGHRLASGFIFGIGFRTLMFICENGSP
jgi:hypothetical protein